jgi:hypothetical protein
MIRRNPSLSLPAVFALLLLVSACGGTTHAQRPTLSTAGSGRPRSYIAVENAARAVARALRTHDCAALTRVSVYKRLNPARCRQSIDIASGSAVGRIATYGVGGVADLKLADGRDAVAAFVVGAGRQWRFVLALRTARPIVGTHPEDLQRGAAVITSVLHAIGSGQCGRVVQDFPMRTGNSAGSPHNCYGHARRNFQQAVKRGFRGPRPMGGNAAVAFYLVLVDGPHPFTFVVGTQRGSPRLLAYSSNPPLGVLVSGRLAPR